MTKITSAQKGNRMIAIFLPKGLKAPEDAPDGEGDDLALPRLVRSVHLHLV